jgi:hypothetical protein
LWGDFLGQRNTAAGTTREGADELAAFRSHVVSLRCFTTSHEAQSTTVAALYGITGGTSACRGGPEWSWFSP